MKTRALSVLVAVVLLACGNGRAEAERLAEEESARQQAAAAEAAVQATQEAAREAEAARVAAAAAEAPAFVGTHTTVDVPPAERGGGDAPWIGYAGEGFRYQVPPGFTAVPHPDAGQAWVGTRASMIGEAPVGVTIFAMRRAFAGDLGAWEAEETARITAAGGEVSSMDAVIFGAAGGPAKQLTITEGGRTRLVRGAIRDGFLYTAACETDAAQYMGVGADCAIAVSTLHFNP